MASEVPPNASQDGAPVMDMSMYTVVDGKYTYTAPDGITYAWDADQQNWVPFQTEALPGYGVWESDKEDDAAEQELIRLQYEAALGMPEGTASSNNKNKKRRGGPNEAGGKGNPADGKDDASDEESGVSRPSAVVYVTGLPTDKNTDDEFAEFFSKRCGILKVDFETGKPKVKLYRTEQGFLKGDGWVSFLRPESVDLALQLLDGAEYRPGYRITVTQAEFENKGEPRKRKKLDKRKIKAQMMQINKKLEWFEEGEKSNKYNRIVILKHMFEPSEIEEDPGLLLDLKDDLRSECEKLGEITTVHVFDKHPEGVCSVKFKDENAALECVRRKLEVSIYDGKTRYDIVNAEEDIDEETRLKRYGDWLEGRDTQSKPAASSAGSATNRNNGGTSSNRSGASAAAGTSAGKGKMVAADDELEDDE